jgi:CRP-like cAMP-binding protein
MMRGSDPTSKAFHGMLRFLSDADRERFFVACKEQRFQAGSHLFSQGTCYSTTFVIRSGLVRTYYVSPKGEEITIAYWSDGALVGGPSVFNEGSVHIWSAQAVDDTVTRSIRGRDLEKLVLQEPAVAVALVNALSFKLHWTSVLLQGFGTDSVRGRLGHLLLQLAEHYGVDRPSGTVIKYHFNHEELGRMVGASRPWITRTLITLKREGILGAEGHHLVIRDEEALRQMTFHPD